MSNTQALQPSEVLTVIRDVARSEEVQLHGGRLDEGSRALNVLPWDKVYERALGEAAVIAQHINTAIPADNPLIDAYSTLRYDPWQKSQERSIRHSFALFGKVLDIAHREGAIDLDRVPMFRTASAFTAASLAIRGMLRPTGKGMVESFPIASFMTPLEVAEVVASSEVCVSLPRISTIIQATRTRPELRAGMLTAVADDFHAKQAAARDKREQQKQQRRQPQPTMQPVLV